MKTLVCMLLLLVGAAMALAKPHSVPSAERDKRERDMAIRLQAQEDHIWRLWLPGRTLLKDYRRARKCYTNFHLFKVDTCDRELDRVDLDLQLRKNELDDLLGEPPDRSDTQSYGHSRYRIRPALQLKFPGPRFIE